MESSIRQFFGSAAAAMAAAAGVCTSDYERSRYCPSEN
jgi:purine-cytosine permease-like protein